MEIKLAIQGGVTKQVKAWNSICPGESDNRIAVVQEKSAVVFEARHSTAVSVQAAWPVCCDGICAAFRFIGLSLESGETKEIVFGDVVGQDAQEALTAALAIVRNFEAEAVRSREGFCTSEGGIHAGEHRFQRIATVAGYNRRFRAATVSHSFGHAAVSIAAQPRLRFTAPPTQRCASLLGDDNISVGHQSQLDHVVALDPACVGRYG